MEQPSVTPAPAFRLPAEWEPHAATWLAWPHEPSDWPGKFEPIPHLYCEIIRILSRHEDVRILIPRHLRPQARALLRQAGAWNDRVSFVNAPTDRSWTRDFCPLFVQGPNSARAAVKFHFNGWAKYDNWTGDDRAGELAARAAGLRPEYPLWNGRRVVLEGGSIDVNGQGLLLTTEECLLSPVQERNPGLGREEYEALFEGWLGVQRTIWLNRGIHGDDTHGHVDDLARFTGPNTVVLAVEDHPASPNYEPLQENLRLLRGARNLDGRPLRVVTLPMPKPVAYDRQPLPASYANFYIANSVVLVPVFHDPADRIALNTLQKLFSDRQVIGIYSVDLVLGLGTLHCMTMQEPA
ncbi:MAG: agmatine deiminase family protein [Bryobacteraceae bacterium]|nr:agmatine deiminase family protein [Bryobacteraceae bacterium]